MRLTILSLIALSACVEKDLLFADDTGGAEEGPNADGSHSRAVVATVSADYAVGGLSLIRMQDWSVLDGLTTLGADPQVRVTGGRLVELNRGTENSARIYALGSFEEPLIEFSVGDGANPHDAAICGDALWLSKYGEAELGVYDPESGAALATVNLASYADADGLPEPSSMVVVGDTLYLAMERLDENSAHWTSDYGVIAQIDCATAEITETWQVGPSPTITANPSDPSTLLGRTGTYFDADGAFAWDGALWTLDPGASAITALGVHEADLEVNLGSVAAGSNGRALLLSTDSSWLYTASCVDLETGEITAIATVDTFLSDVAVNDQNQAWVASRASWAAPDAVGGVLVYDLETCTELSADTGPISLAIEPYSLAFY